MATQVPVAPPASSAGVRAVMQGNRSSDTRAELALRSALHRAGMRFLKNTRPGPGLPRVDVLFTRACLALFLDGCYWHSCPEHGTRPKTNSAYWEAKLRANVVRDRKNDDALAAAGWRVLRIWEHEEPDEVAQRVRRAYQEQLGGEA